MKRRSRLRVFDTPGESNGPTTVTPSIIRGARRPCPKDPPVPVLTNSSVSNFGPLNKGNDDIVDARPDLNRDIREALHHLRPGRSSAVIDDGSGLPVHPAPCETLPGHPPTE